MRKTMLVLVGALFASLYISLPAMANDKPVVYLTFDDGPSADGSTSSILATANQYGVPVTFFLVGYRIALEPEMIREIVESGQAIGNHTWDHPHMPRLSLSAQTNQLNETQDLISELTGGYQPTCWRPPYGDTNEITEARAEAMGLTQVLWTVDTMDFAHKNRWKILDELNAHVKDGSIVLMHDGPNNRLETAAAFELWLATNHDRYDFRFAPGCTPPIQEVHEPLPPCTGDKPCTQIGYQDLGGEWYLDGYSGEFSSFYYGNPGDMPFVGDWNCDGIDTPGLYRQSDGFVYLRQSNTQGVADIRFYFGNPGDIPIAGDFDGDGCDTVSLYRPGEGTAYIINRLGENEGGLGVAEYSYVFGDPGDKPFVGDFDGDGVDTLGMHRAKYGLVYIKNTNSSGVADEVYQLGDSEDTVLAGDWNGDGRDEPAVYRSSGFQWLGISSNPIRFGSYLAQPISGVFSD